MLLATAPRAAEMLTMLGRDPTTELPCLIDVATQSDSDGVGLVPAVKAKAAMKCEAVLAKAAVTQEDAGFLPCRPAHPMPVGCPHGARRYRAFVASP